MRSLGGLLVAGFQLAAMSRADVPEEARRDFFLGVDEFQHFGNELPPTGAFVSILSETRKYRLSLTLSHQYLDQVPPGISDAALGNVGSLAVFRVGAPDTAGLGKELVPSFHVQDLIHPPNYRFCARVTRNSGTLPAFSARTLTLPPGSVDLSGVLGQFRRHWAGHSSAVELEAADFWERR